MAVVTPNLAAKPDTLLTNKVTIKGEKQAVQMFGPAQAAVARAVVDSVAEGVIPKDQVDDLLHHRPASSSTGTPSYDKKIYDYNYEAVKLSIARALCRRAVDRHGARRHPAARDPFACGAKD